MESGGACSAPTKELACDIAPYQIQTFWDRSYYFFFPASTPPICESVRLVSRLD